MSVGALSSAPSSLFADTSLLEHRTFNAISEGTNILVRSARLKKFGIPWYLSVSEQWLFCLV